MSTESFAIRFDGDWPWWAGVLAGVLIAAISSAIYSRELAGVYRRGFWCLPVLRGLAVALIVMLLTGPVLHRREVIGQLGKVFVVMDGSQSMEQSDPAMSPAQRALVLARLGLVASQELPLHFADAAQSLVGAHSAGLALKKESEPALMRTSAQEILSQTERCAKIVSREGPADLDRFNRELLFPVRRLVSTGLTTENDRLRALEQWAPIARGMELWKEELLGKFNGAIEEKRGSGNAPWARSLLQSQAMTRAQRLGTFLLTKLPTPFLTELARSHEVHVFFQGDKGLSPLWNSGAAAGLSGLPKFDGSVTDLASALGAVSAQIGADGRSAVVLLSDGHHNGEGSLPEAARLLGTRGIPVHTVGMGSPLRPPDIALMKVEAPESVFFEDRVRGQVILKDDMPAGLPFKVSVREGETVLWEESFVTSGEHLRKIPFEFAVKKQVAARVELGKQERLEFACVPLDLQVELSPVAGDVEPGNQTGALRLRALTQKRKVLIVDGRPRWETRFLRNLFERNPQWEVRTVLAGVKTEELALARGNLPDEWPLSSVELDGFDLLVLGDVPGNLWRPEEWAWIRDFVVRRGGGLILIDGPREGLRGYGHTPIGPLVPVEWAGNAGGVHEGIAGFEFNERGALHSALMLASERDANAQIWSQLPAPHWVSGGLPKPGAETLLDLRVHTRKLPGAVYWPVGAGKVFYHGFEDSWRWRSGVADQHHGRYWNQVAQWIAEAPFAVRDKFVSLDAGPLTYRPGDQADLRVRLRDGRGAPVTQAAVDAVLVRDGIGAGSVRLVADEGGVFRGKTAALEPGNYEVRLESEAIPASELKAKTTFKVQPPETRELTQIHLNEELLMEVAANSGGRYLREENAGALLEVLAPMSRGKVIETQTVLWQSPWWFWSVIALLTAEWALRKRWGLL
jgi:hypothetical protein